jgi:hypothetical protein
MMTQMLMLSAAHMREPQPARREGVWGERDCASQ